MLLCFGCLIIFIGAKHKAFLTRQKFKGDFLRNSRTRSKTNCLYRLFNFLFLSAEVCGFFKRSLAAAPRSTNPSSKWCFVLISYFLFNLFNGVSALSRASFRNIRGNSWLRIVSNSPLIYGTIGLSVWKIVRYGLSIPARKEKNCILMGISGSR